MAGPYTGGTPAPTLPRGTGGTPAPASRAAAQRVQRYYNKASGRMETPQQMRAYRAPAPQGRQAPHASQTAPREAPAEQSQPTSFINMSVPQIEARARQIVSSELAANRVPFQQQQSVLGQEQQSALAGNAASYGKLDSSIAGQQAAQEASAKTFANYAADAVNKASTAAPGAAETAERLGLKQGEKLPESAQRQQEAARTLLTGIAAAGQSGTTARQQTESNWLTNMRATAAQAGTEGAKAIEGQYAKQKAGLANQEAALVAKGAGATSSLAQRLFGEQEKLKIAAGGLGIKSQEAERHGAETRSNIQNRGEQRQGERAKIGQGQQKLNQGEQKLAQAREKWNAEAGKRGRTTTKEKLDIQSKELGIRKHIEEGNGKTGKPLTKVQVNALTKEFTNAFETFKQARAAGASPAEIREALIGGKHRVTPSSKETEAGKKPYWAPNSKVTNQALINAAEEIMQKEYVGTATKQALREMGLPDSGWSQRLIGGRPGRGAPQVRGK